MLICFLGGVIGCLIALPINGIATSTTNFQSFSEVGFSFAVTPQALLAGLVFSIVLGLVARGIPQRIRSTRIVTAGAPSRASLTK